MEKEFEEVLLKCGVDINHPYLSAHRIQIINAMQAAYNKAIEKCQNKLIESASSDKSIYDFTTCLEDMEKLKLLKK
jgi:hypothetical protein